MCVPCEFVPRVLGMLCVLCASHCCARRPAARGPTPPFTSNLTNITFYLNTSLGTWADSQLGCNLKGGHLAAYTAQEEQVGAAARPSPAMHVHNVCTPSLP